MFDSGKDEIIKELKAFQNFLIETLAEERRIKNKLMETVFTMQNIPYELDQDGQIQPNINAPPKEGDVEIPETPRIVKRISHFQARLRQDLESQHRARLAKEAIQSGKPATPPRI